MLLLVDLLGSLVVRVPVVQMAALAGPDRASAGREKIVKRVYWALTNPKGVCDENSGY